MKHTTTRRPAIDWNGSEGDRLLTVVRLSSDLETLTRLAQETRKLLAAAHSEFRASRQRARAR
jgi:hypothetical protein